MFLHALATAVPDRSLSQRESWEILQQSEVRERLTRRSALMMQAILRGDSGIGKRHFAVSGIESVWKRTPDELNEAFRTEAPRLAGTALKAALAQAGLVPGEIDALLICTCTGYLCPGVTSYVAEQLGLRANAWLQDLVGLGCGAAIPLLRAGEAVLAVQPDAVVACVAVEVCSAAFYLDDDPGVLVSACLFGDGAAAMILRAKPGPTGLRCHGFNTMHQPDYRDFIRFETRNGRLRNLLRPEVPKLAAAAVKHLLDEEHARSGAKPVLRLITHTGGRDVLLAIMEACPGHPLDASRKVLHGYGNMSSPSVLFALEQALRDDAAPDGRGDWLLVAFGAGFSAHACRVGR
ncbi:MAG: stilbene synthase [Rariglobus sp.]|jgi:alkylresorcinol/alkylpyrone synthase|nr:stilbene synthase [Rariglobus sp.]